MIIIKIKLIAENYNKTKKCCDKHYNNTTIIII